MMRPLGRLRSLLFAPAVRPELIAKMPGTGTDGLVIDLEDATPPGAKAEGRANAARLAVELDGCGAQVFVRVNPVGSPWFADDVAAGLAPGLAGVVLPKVESPAQLDEATRALAAAGLGHLGVIAGLETALGVADARLATSHPLVAAAYFGAEDFIADVGGVRTPGNAEVATARAMVALACRIGEVPALDQIVADFRDDAAFRREAAEARALGYRGKLCIHPRQVTLANEAFTATVDELDRARRLLAAYDEASARGVSAIDFEGRMVDAPLAAQARAILAQAEAV